MKNRDVNKILILTMTGETFQPARIYYKLFDEKEKIIKIFLRLGCMYFDKRYNQWTWLYRNEAKKLKFKYPYSSIPREKQPLILGKFSFKTKDEFVLSVNSFERVTKAIVFFDNYIRKKFAKALELEIINKLLDVSASDNLLDTDVLFDKYGPPHKIDPETVIKDFYETAAKGKTKEEGIAKVYLLHQELSKKSLPIVERIPTNYYESGISQLQGGLNLRQIVAYRHWNGETDITVHDIIEEAVRSGKL